ncbi:hypothetical protein GCM10020000_55600 [Streptomyces olivoverticillatus]
MGWRSGLLIPLSVSDSMSDNLEYQGYDGARTGPRGFPGPGPQPYRRRKPSVGTARRSGQGRDAAGSTPSRKA